MNIHKALEFFIALLRLLEATWPDLPWSIVSYSRSPSHNTAVGGAADSRHLDWEAADLQPDVPADLEQLKTHVTAVGLHYDDSKYGTLHVQLTAPRPRAA
jgi:uncharacterized protein YcbK (DUF882 family)